MPDTRPELRLGRIIWAVLKDRHGIRKKRPAIIVTRTADIREDEPFVAMAISTSYPDPPPNDHIELPWNPDRRRVHTRLNRRSAAVLNWLRHIHPREVQELAGDVPPRLMIQILRRLDKLEHHST